MVAADEPKLGDSPLKLAETLSRSKAFPWYQEDLGSRLTPQCRNLLESYSGIPAAKVEKHVYEMRETAWAVFPFPCIGEFWFLTLGLSNHPKYDILLARMTSTPTALIDIGTCFGQDLRKLVYDGVPPAQLLGVDVFPTFEQIGQQFFRDEDRFVGRFKTADLFAADSSLTGLRNTQDVITATMFLHSFDWATQVLACKKMLMLARGVGSWIMGGLSGSGHASEYWLKPPFVPEGVKKNVYMHDKDSLVHMWEQVAKESNIKVDIYAEYDSGDTEAKRVAEQGGSNFFAGFKQKLLWFKVEILEVAAEVA
ncbi:hypothetical protein BGZ60DRAFT_495568 [Tricladium varicosporioides]|nr:hypothetical protein BGZ60DRAFT_495568 [Hymenoscyphus varicosporioides]